MTAVHVWWLSISLVAVINIVVWSYFATRLAQHHRSIQKRFVPWRRWVFWLSGIYVMVCAFRSFLPRIDLERICLVDSWLSSMFLGRTLATIAEIAFIIQCAILLREAAIGVGDRTTALVSRVILPIVLIAEGFSWYAALTTNYFGSVIEESLWAAVGAMLLASFVCLWTRVNRQQRLFMGAMSVYALGFVIFMVTVDVPMYWHRWHEDTVTGVTYYSFANGLADMLRSCAVNFAFNIWRDEIPWMTLYFSVTVWVSMAFAFAPSFKSAAGKGD